LVSELEEKCEKKEPEPTPHLSSRGASAARSGGRTSGKLNDLNETEMEGE